MSKYKIFTDGGSRGNPGPAAIGVVVISQETNKEIHQISKRIGNATNNIAEYMAVEAALDWLNDNLPITAVQFYLDSELVQRQLSGIYKVKDTNLKQIFLRIREKSITLNALITYDHIRRELNAEADALVNKALDEAS